MGESIGIEEKIVGDLLNKEYSLLFSIPEYVIYWKVKPSVIWNQCRLIIQLQQRKHPPRGAVGASQSVDVRKDVFGGQRKEEMLGSALDAARKPGISINLV